MELRDASARWTTSVHGFSAVRVSLNPDVLDLSSLALYLLLQFLC